MLDTYSEPFLPKIEYVDIPDGYIKVLTNGYTGQLVGLYVFYKKGECSNNG